MEGGAPPPLYEPRQSASMSDSSSVIPIASRQKAIACSEVYLDGRQKDNRKRG